MSMNIIIIGGGVVGLNTALYLAQTGKNDEIFVLEAEDFLGAHTSTRNSEVIHAGFNYPKDSLKSRLCVEGNRLTYELLARLNVPHKICGKWIVAFTRGEGEALERVLENASLSNVTGMRLRAPREANSLMPWLKPVSSAVFSETSGILDSSEYITALDRALHQTGRCQVILPCRVQSIDVEKSLALTTRGPMNFDILINSAGLFADDVYKMAGGKRNFEIRPFKGEYYICRRPKFSGLIYPVPTRFLKGEDPKLISSMGVHLHSSVAGESFIGPTQVEMPKEKKTDYKIETPPEFFALSAGRYLKEPPNANDLSPSQAGNRPKLFEDGKPIGDFVIIKEGPCIHLLGIESPGLTAAPAIARHVSAMTASRKNSF